MVLGAELVPNKAAALGPAAEPAADMPSPVLGAELMVLGAELVPNEVPPMLGPAAEPAANMPSPVLGAELMVLGAELVPNKGLGLNEKTPVLAGIMVLSEDSGVRLPPILFAIVRFAPLSDECEVD
jgi:hypothetical protein